MSPLKNPHSHATSDFRGGENAPAETPWTLTTAPGDEAVDTHWGQQTLALPGLPDAEKEGNLQGEIEIFRVTGSPRMYDAKVTSWSYGSSSGDAVYYVVA